MTFDLPSLNQLIVGRVLHSGEWLSPSEIAFELRCTEKYVRDVLEWAQRKGILLRRETKSGTYQSVTYGKPLWKTVKKIDTERLRQEMKWVERRASRGSYPRSRAVTLPWA
jgi:hypothetical protein